MRNGHKSSMLCPCVGCKKEKQYSNSLSVHAHLILRGFIDDYRCWNKHGEEGVNDRHGEEGLHETCDDGKEAPFGNEELCDDDVAEIAASPVPMVENLEKMKIHACKNVCILFRGDNAALTECPKCGISRYKRRNDKGDDG
ncbi:unnamed protein product [Miscanthus lutarioriparius]|uniref:Transposase-associated domain-containing protein n=1 Tax=Miscanthus lutarioriparius TaxID=422564 RepID=A0A811Q6E4_9POAL|nr:unnamed protein product [Miscanthus lutarioriparius]